MRQIKLIVLGLTLGVILGLITTKCSAQSQMSYQLGWGVDYLNDQSAVITGTRAGSISGRATYWKNPTFGIGAEMFGSIWELENLDKDRDTYNFGRITIPLSLDVSHILKFDNKSYRLIVSGGPGVSRIKSDTHKEWMPNVSGTIENLIYLDDNLAFNILLMSSSNLSQEHTLDGSYKTTARGVTSVVHSLQFGLVYKPKWPKRVEPVRQPQAIQTTVNNSWNLNQTTMLRPNGFYVFFDHDKSTWHSEKTPTGNLEQLYRVKKYAEEHPEKEIILTAYASNTKSSNAYNMKLAERRVEFIKQALLTLGVKNEISLVTVGKEMDEHYLQVARRVEILFKE